MYLIDSSAWVEYFRAGGSSKIKDTIREILQKEEALCCGIVLVEILRGAKSEKDYRSLYESLTSLPQIPMDGEVTNRASMWGYMLDRKGKTVSTTGLFIASAAYKKARLLHIDGDFEKIASVVGLEEEKLHR